MKSAVHAILRLRFIAVVSLLLPTLALIASDREQFNPNGPGNTPDILSPDPQPASASSPMTLDEPEIGATWVGTTKWISGVDWGGETFNGSIGKGADFFGSSVTNADYVPVRIEFSNSTTTLCQTFRRPGYASAGVGTFPGAAYDMSDPGNPRRLNLCFVENTASTPNFVWDPNAQGGSDPGKREYLAVMLSSYDGTGTTYAGANFNTDANSMDQLYVWWPQLIPGHTLLEVLPAAIDIELHYVRNFRSIPDDGEVTLTWEYYFDPDSFRVYGSETTPPASNWLGTVNGSVREFIQGSLTNGTDTYYRIEAYDGGLLHSDSREIHTKPGVYYSNMTRYGVWHQRDTYGGIWGYVDSASGNEYALICCRNEGVAVIDINVTPPVEVSFLPSLAPGNDAKEVQVYRHYAIVVKENEDIQIWNLQNIASPVQVSTINPGNNGSHTCLVDGHYLYSQGNHAGGGLKIYDIVNPAAPVALGMYSPYYYHDIAIRKDTVYAFAIYGQGIDVINVANKNVPSLITTFNYPGSGTHNGVVSADGQYLYIGDEIGSSGNWTRVFDISDINNVTLVSEIIVDSAGIAHNCYLRGDLLFIAHYGFGCRVWDVSDPLNPVEVACYDTYEEPSYTYVGMWTAYPLLPSGKIICSDMQTGLWVLTLDCLCPCAGDPQCDGIVTDVLDVITVVNAAFRGFAPIIDPACAYERTDLNCSSETDVLDVVAAVNVSFRGGNPATEFCDPCL